MGSQRVGQDGKTLQQMLGLRIRGAKRSRPSESLYSRVGTCVSKNQIFVERESPYRQGIGKEGSGKGVKCKK